MKTLKRMFSIILLFGMACFVMADQAFEEVTIYRDSFGTAHIQAPSMETLFTAWGYTTAQDRLFTLETLRAASQGRVAEMFGPGENNIFIEFDKSQRIANVPRKGKLQKEIASLPPVYRKLLQAYANGINMWIDKVLEKPDEWLHYAFSYHGITTIEPWTQWDVAQSINWVFGGAWLNSLNLETINLAIYSYLVTTFGEEAAQKILDDLLPITVPDHIPSLPGYTLDRPADVTFKAKRNKINITITNGIIEACQKAMAQMEVRRKVFKELGMPLKEGSYMFMVGGQKTEGNDTYCFGGPQSGYFYPSRFYETGLHCPGMNVVGISPFGIPLLLMGANENVAYNATSNFANVMDIFILTLTRDNYHYIYDGKRKKMKRRKERINVKGQDAVEFDVYSCVYGPVYVWGEGVAFAQKQSWAGKGLDNFVSLIKQMRSGSGAEFQEACRNINTAVNYGYSDNQGNFGYIFCGRIPITNADIDLRLPTPGTGQYDWQGYHPFSWNPKGANLDRGYIVNWNNAPAPDYKDYDGYFGYWNSYCRAHRLYDLLDAKDKVTLADAKAMIKDITTFEPHSIYLFPYFEQALEDETDERLLAALDFVRNWGKHNVDDDYDGYYDGAGYTIWKAWIEEVFTSSFADELGPFFLLKDGFFGYTPFLPNLVLHHLQGENSAVPIQYEEWLNGATIDQMIRNSLIKALDDLTVQYPDHEMEDWLTPTNPLVFVSGFFPGVPGGPIGVRDVRVYIDRATYDHLIHFSNGEVAESVNISAPGTSGFVAPDGTPSPHFDDQIDLFEDFNGYKAMHVYLDDAIQDAQSVEVLVVKRKGKNH